ncbi:MAG: DUF1415 domain-containing protein [Vulcanimicrobiota bacterium]
MAELIDLIIVEVERWLRDRVVGWNLCPFARKELLQQTIRFRVSQAEDEETLLADLVAEFELLDQDSSIETTLLIHPRLLTNFADYNDFLGLAEALLEQMELEGIYQIASFHPQYQFSGTGPDDPENYTNRSPYPLLHILREDSVTQATDSYSGVEQIPERNISLMNEKGQAELQKLFPWSNASQGL